MEAHAIANEKPFSHTMEVFDGLLRKLEGPEWAALSHGQVEQALRVEGWELLRVMYEDQLNLRAQASPRRRWSTAMPCLFPGARASARVRP